MPLRWLRNRGVRAGDALLLIPLGIIAAVVAADVLAPMDIHLGPLLITAPAVTASFAGPRTVAVMGAASIAAQVAIGVARDVLDTRNVQAQIAALVVISALLVVFSVLRERHGRELAEVRSVSAAAQEAVLRPLPPRAGPLRLASFYLAAHRQAQIGGDLYAAVRTRTGTRLVIGDVMGKGLTAIGDSSLLLGAFRAAAHREASLDELVGYLESSVCWNLNDPAEADRRGEVFITAAFLDVPDDAPVARLVSCGHPPPVLLHAGRAVPLIATATPPLGLCGLTPRGPVDVLEFPFGPGDHLVLYTDGITEARDGTGTFYPLTERLGTWAPDGLHSPKAFVHRLRDDVLAYVNGRLGDDAAAVVVQRTTHQDDDRPGPPAGHEAT
ncbi:PP2C family protein-serine/threonine phosphatase [Streptantibioticus parmotrematis]|uniref:PP2C family protein-serine/threonine phosphatase n=1 Tax=Streptantibioticus parmotrematis TaxID=2873249 RepID=UPI0033CAE0BF